MTQRTIRKCFRLAIYYFVMMATAGALISLADHSEKRIAYSTFKDLIPFFIAIPAAWLGFCVQRRSSYLQQLRAIWSKLIDAIQNAIQYTQIANPTPNDHTNAILKISIVIDEIRGVFQNIDESNHCDGLYPFEPLKDIHGDLLRLGIGNASDPNRAKEARARIFALWKDVRRELLKEFDREVPSFPHCHWTDIEKSRVYDENRIPRRPS